mgnify:CR=1 FL=1
MIVKTADFAEMNHTCAAIHRHVVTFVALMSRHNG